MVDALACGMADWEDVLYVAHKRAAGNDQKLYDNPKGEITCESPRLCLASLLSLSPTPEATNV
jgi:hypothetical protein